jgi:hypothetical protein
LAKYALQVLARQLDKARTGYLGKLNPRMKKANKTIRANSFAQGWVLQAGEQAGALRSRVPDDKETAIDAYIGRKLGELGQVRTGWAAARTCGPRTSSRWPSRRRTSWPPWPWTASSTASRPCAAG